MASIGFFEISIAFVCFLVFHFFFNKKTHKSIPTTWPILGMLPCLPLVLPIIFDYGVEVLENSKLTFLFKGPWFAGLDLLFTVDPANIHHILSSNFSNYPKGPEFKKIFDIFGDGIFNADAELWMDLRKSAHMIISNQEFQRFTLSTTKSKLEKGLMPLLDLVAEKKMVVDLQDLFQRFAFDTTFLLVTGYDPGCLSVEMPEIEFVKALDAVEAAIVYRHIKPTFLWKLQHWVGLGEEKNMRRAQATLDNLCAKYISAKRDEIKQGTHSKGEALDMLSSYVDLDTTTYKHLNPGDDKFLRDTILSFMLAGRDSSTTALTWFFYLLSKNPEAVTKIRQEINTVRSTRPGNNETKSFDHADLDKLVYLHAAFCEALRLYPPVPFQHKSPAKADVLPSGHKVNANSKILFFLYAMGRMRSIWGDDASEFKPERWITKKGGLKHEPSFKFLAFNAGPRACLGKEVTFTTVKTVAAEIIPNYDIKVVEGHKVEPELSLILHMKYGLSVTITKRCLA